MVLRVEVAGVRTARGLGNGPPVLGLQGVSYRAVIYTAGAGPTLDIFPGINLVASC